MGMARKISKEEVVEKLKDDGDFDRLRLKIIRRLKENVSPLSLSPSSSHCTSCVFLSLLL
jgi:hypothetical protein